MHLYININTFVTPSKNKLMENMKDLIYECNMQNIQFQPGMGGSYYTVQNLIHSGSPALINSLYEFYATKLEKVSTKSLVKKSTEADTLRLMLSTLEALYEYKNQMLKEINVQREYDKLTKARQADLEKKIAELEAELES